MMNELLDLDRWRAPSTYEVLTLPANDVAFERFMEMRGLWTWLRGMQKWEKDNPEAPRIIEKVGEK